MERWSAKEGSVIEDVAARAGAKRSAAAVVTGDAVVVGEELDKYWTLKKRMAAGAQPPRVAAMLAALKRAGVAHGAALCGAGGGGFLVVVTKEADDRAGVLEALGVWKAGASLHRCDVDREGERRRCARGRRRLSVMGVVRPGCPPCAPSLRRPFASRRRRGVFSLSPRGTRADRDALPSDDNFAARSGRRRQEWRNHAAGEARGRTTEPRSRARGPA